MVFPGAFLHSETDSQPRVEDRRRTARTARLRIAGDMVGGAAVLGVHPGRFGTRPVGHGRRRPPAGLSGHVLSLGVLAMKNLLLLLPLAAASLLAAGKDSCVQCHANLDGDLQAPAVKFPSKDIHAQVGLSCTDCHGGDRNTDDYEASMSKAKGFVGKIAR